MKNLPPTLETERLILRPFTVSDAQRVKELAGDLRVYETTLNVPHPYEDGMAEQWIESHHTNFLDGKSVVLGIEKKEEKGIIGTVGLNADPKHKKAELVYWIGYPFWNKGYCTEAAEALLKYGIEELKYHKIAARYMEKNPASGKVMEKIGMKKEGVLVDEVFKDGEFHTLILYGKINTANKALERNSETLRASESLS
jgi:ribosomal-protein-alanine N-acetyltransferase